MSLYPTGAQVRAFPVDVDDDALLALSERKGREMLAKLDEMLAQAMEIEQRIRGTWPCEPCSDTLSDRASWWSCLREELEHATAEAKRLAHGEKPKRARLIVRGAEVVGMTP
jgi:hypothetical protein